ncbi:hypothetical protein CBL_01993 [Carabus blaptoides fortunei]
MDSRLGPLSMNTISAPLFGYIQPATKATRNTQLNLPASTEEEHSVISTRASCHRHPILFICDPRVRILTGFTHLPFIHRQLTFDNVKMNRPSLAWQESCTTVDTLSL